MAKGQTRWTGFDDKIISMYARGMTTREILWGACFVHPGVEYARDYERLKEQKLLVNMGSLECLATECSNKEESEVVLDAQSAYSFTLRRPLQIQ